jgi:hypothetical protein
MTSQINALVSARYRILCQLNHAMFPNYLCDNSFRDATYDEVYSASDF